MEDGQFYFRIVALLVKGITIFAFDIKDSNTYDVTSIETMAAYSLGFYMGIINPKKYTLESFKRDERAIFKNLYKEYKFSSNDTILMTYPDWLIMNHYGILPDSQESLFEKKSLKRNGLDSKKRFLNSVRKGDILITGRGKIGWLLGHAAIMTSDYYVLEMAGGRLWHSKIVDNNRQIGKDQWFDKHSTYWIIVYRCPDAVVAGQAATWVNFTYYNGANESRKTKHITYAITTDVWSLNPSYCSKLVLHAYYYGTRGKEVVRDLSTMGNIIVPTMIPFYFLRPYKLLNVGKF